MRICPNCKYVNEEEINFCPQCGTAMVAPEPVAVAVEETAPEVPVIPSEPVFTAPAQPTAPAEPTFTAPAQPTYTAPEQPTYTVPTQPVTYYQPTVPAEKPHLALKIVSMALSIFGLLMAAYGGLYTLIGLVEDGMAFVFALIFGMFSVPASIVGLCLASKCRAAGDTSIFSRLGKILGMIGIIVAGANLLIGLLSIASY